MTCPPYDVVGARAARDFESRHPHNVIRLILPRNGADEDRYHHARRDLAHWLATGVLRRDPDPALYVYEHRGPDGVALGLVGGVPVDGTAEGPVVAHEDTFEGPVADRLVLMRTTQAQLEPILLTYDGDGPASDVVDAAIGDRPLFHVETDDGGHHRIWPVRDPDHLRTITTDLRERSALIADGHHRFAAYRRVHATASPPGGAAGGARVGLAMLVDARRHPLTLRGVHRSVAGMSLDAALASARPGFVVTPLPDHAAAVDRLRTDLPGTTAEGAATFVVGDGVRWALLQARPGTAVAGTEAVGHSIAWRRLDAAVLRHVLLATLWKIADDEVRVGIHHDAEDAVATATRTGGVAVLVRPPLLEDVMALAHNGERMPPKSTSFGPKPRTGLLMRLLAD